ncbi:SCP2 sterol-binding domain-containing protein [Micromonospora sp. NPDC000089]|uniref:SCP2 sterol-binding domain-containing protein n=1 Tax=unclassified Micromonospora TaxID=2617518 RepID=UPI0036B0E9B3
MAMSAAQFLEQLDRGPHRDLPENTAGTIRLDLRDGPRTDHWYLTIGDQRVRVTRSADDAELIVRGDREVFDRLAGGRRRLVESLLRNDLTVHGNIRLFMSLRRLFPGPPDARHPREAAREEVGAR